MLFCNGGCGGGGVWIQAREEICLQAVTQGQIVLIGEGLLVESRQDDE